MKRASVSQVKSRLSAYLKDVQRGETVLIFHRDKAVARLEPVAWRDLSQEDRIRELVRLGVARAPRKKLDVKAFLQMPGPRISAQAATRAVIRERQESP